jgi:hypothetical protein
VENIYISALYSVYVFLSLTTLAVTEETQQITSENEYAITSLQDLSELRRECRWRKEGEKW